MCKYCDSASNECEIFFEPLTQEYFLNIQTSEWDTYNDDWVYQKNTLVTVLGAEETLRIRLIS